MFKFMIAVAGALAIFATPVFADRIVTETKRFPLTWKHEGVESKDWHWLRSFAKSVCESQVSAKVKEANSATDNIQYEASRVDVENFVIDGTKTWVDPWPSPARHFHAWGKGSCVYDLKITIKI